MWIDNKKTRLDQNDIEAIRDIITIAKKCKVGTMAVPLYLLEGLMNDAIVDENKLLILAERQVRLEKKINMLKDRLKRYEP
jgi:hypothetical protein